MIELKAFRFGYNFTVSLYFQSLLLAATAVIKIPYNVLAFNFKVALMQQFPFFRMKVTGNFFIFFQKC